jgi:hypothetical protein
VERCRRRLTSGVACDAVGATQALPLLADVVAAEVDFINLKAFSHRNSPGSQVYFLPKIQIRVNFIEGLGMYLIMLEYLCNGDLVYFVDIWYIMWSFGMFFPFWYVSPRKILQPL